MFNKKLGVVALLMGLSPMVDAAPITFDISATNSSVSTRNVIPEYPETPLPCVDCAIEAELAAGLEDTSFTLAPGESWTFDFLTLNFAGYGLMGGVVDAILAFDSPDGAGDIEAHAIGGAFVGDDPSDGSKPNVGAFEWFDLDPFMLANGQRFTLELEDLQGFSPDASLSVSATVTLLDDGTGPTPVPEPSAVALLALGLIGTGLANRPRRRQR